MAADLLGDRPEKAPTKLLLEHFCALHCHYRHEPIAITGRDAKSLVPHWRTLGAERLMQLMGAFFTDPDPFVRQGGYSVTKFVYHLPRLMAHNPARPVKTDWWEDCQRDHAGACSSRWHHEMKGE